MTNADRIRQMTDEELISFLIDIDIREIPICRLCEVGSDNCGECLKRWLNAEATDD